MHPILWRQLKEAALCHLRFLPMSCDRILNRGGASVVEVGTPEP